MCGRVIQSGATFLPSLTIVLGLPDDPCVTKPKYNGAPSQMLRVIRQKSNSETNQLDMLEWGLIPNWVKEPKYQPINAACERIARTDVPVGLRQVALADPDGNTIEAGIYAPA